MPTFQLPITEKTPVKVARNQVFYLCVFKLPDTIKERISHYDTLPLEGTYLMGFYCDPVPNDMLTVRGLDWRVIARHHYPTRRNTQDEKKIAELILEFIGEA